MKKLLVLIFVSGLILVACKKDRICKCSVSTNGITTTHVSALAVTTGTDISTGIDTSFTTPLNTRNENESRFYKVTKRRAKNNCFDKSESVNESTQIGIPPVVDISITNTGTRNYECELK